jgi:hypothetical protein
MGAALRIGTSDFHDPHSEGIVPMKLTSALRSRLHIPEG